MDRLVASHIPAAIAVWLCASVALAQNNPLPASYMHRRIASLPPRMEAFTATSEVMPEKSFLVAEPPLPMYDESFETSLVPPQFTPGTPQVSDPLINVPDPYGLAPSQLSEYKNGFFQKLDFQATWIDNRADGDFSVYSLETFASFAVPFFTRDSPLVITPGFGVHYFEGPPAPHVPPRVYDAYLSLLWLRPLTNQLKALLEVKPGIYSDLEEVNRDSFRIQGKGLLIYDAWPGTVQLALGAAYLDRDDFNLLPVGGVIWTPTPNQRHEFIFPQPKFAYRINHWYDWDPAESYEDWLYLRAAFGGDQWEYERLNGSRSVFLMRDYRLVAGIERKRHGGAGMRLELGYVFGRTLEFADGSPDAKGDPAAYLRAGVTF